MDDQTKKDTQRLANGLQKAAELCPADARIERARLTAIAAQKAQPTQAAQLLRNWNGVMDAIASDERYTPGDRLAAV